MLHITEEGPSTIQVFVICGIISDFLEYSYCHLQLSCVLTCALGLASNHYHSNARSNLDHLISPFCNHGKRKATVQEHTLSIASGPKLIQKPDGRVENRRALFSGIHQKSLDHTRHETPKHMRSERISRGKMQKGNLASDRSCRSSRRDCYYRNSFRQSQRHILQRRSLRLDGPAHQSDGEHLARRAQRHNVMPVARACDGSSEPDNYHILAGSDSEEAPFGLACYSRRIQVVQ